MGNMVTSAPIKSQARIIAERLYTELPDIEMLAAEQGQLYQDERVEKEEWIRLVTELIEYELALF